jgi:sigma-B regulation protein RsbU (phosphoserine phosphatase)
MPAILLILALLIFSSFETSKKTVLNLINKEAVEIAQSRVKEFSSLFSSAEKTADEIANITGRMETLSENHVNRLIQETLRKQPDIFGSTISLLPDKTPLGLYAPYYYRANGGLTYLSLATTDYDYLKKEWFTLPIKQEDGLWTPPYLDEGGGDVLMITYSAPIKRNNQIIGVATVDISLQKLVQEVKKLTVGGKGFAFIITKEGKFIAHPDKPLLSDQSLWEFVEENKNKEMNKLITLIQADKSNNLEEIDQFYVIISKIQTLDWTLVIMYPREDILMPLTKLKYKYIAISIIVIVLLIIAIIILSKNLTEPITRLVEQTKLYAEGQWDQRLDEDMGTKELKQLARCFNMMGQAITDQIENVRQTTAQKERYHQELVIAAEIQQSILPQVFPPFPDLEDRLCIFGTTKPAREVGGDYYDFFRLSENKIGLVIADVSDKGAPSSFFMAMTRMLIREIAERGYAPIEVLRRTNHVLAEGNIYSMFVTLIYGEFDTNTGLIKFANAGHNKPLYITNEGEVKQIPLKVNLPLGIMSDTHYYADEFTLKQGETLILYTDGVNEAHNPADEQFGMIRFKDMLKNSQHLDCKQITENILEEVHHFSEGTEQSDDITLLCIKNKIGECHETHKDKVLHDEIITLKFPATTKSLDKLSDMISTVVKGRGFDEIETNRIVLAVDEVVSNVIMHAYAGKTDNTFQVNLIPRTDGICIKIIDYGIPFDFEKSVKAYDSEDASADQPIGGIGLFLAHSSVDEISYEPDTIDGNQLILVKYLKS